ncbi:MAG: M24 family metallopeptidase C-terminal domain-containing protein, partial [Paeniclostridium sp.]
VGFLGTIHEAPNGFRWRINPQRLETATLEEGMVTTNEPGIYIEGSHGIRIENELITKKAEKNEYGQFMEFEVVTFAPIDIDAIDVNDLNREEREYLNNYHKLVYKKIAPYLEEDEVQWLKNYTKEI